MPSPDWMPKYIPVPDNETIMKAVYQVRNDAYTAAFANNGKLAQNVNATSMAAALEFAYEAAGLVAQTGTYKDEYKARIQYIKDTSVLPDGLKGLDANIYFATLDYADMTIGYYMNEAGEKVGKGYVKFKEKSADVIKAMLDAIKDTNYWSKPFRNIDGKNYYNIPCLAGTEGAFGYSYLNIFYNTIQIQEYEMITSPCYGFIDGDIIHVISKVQNIEWYQRTYSDGENIGEFINSMKPAIKVANGWYRVCLLYTSPSPRD